MRKTTEQYRAAAAWEQVYEVKEDSIGDFSTAADGAASLIQKVGFGQAVAFWLAKGGKNEYLVKYLAQWLLKSSNSNTRDKEKRGNDLMQELFKKSSTEYRALTNEALTYLNWLKRFAKGRKKDIKKG